MAENTPTTNAERDPGSPETESVRKVESAVKQTHVDILSHQANLAHLVAGGAAEPAAIDATIEQASAHAETTQFFSEIFALQRNGTLTREELDKRMVNWLLKIPDLKEKFNELPDNVQTCLDQFKDSDLSADNPVPLSADFKPPPSMSTRRKVNKLKTSLEEQHNADQWMKYQDVVESNGAKVMYVEKFPFENWGQTVANIPAVTFIPKSIVGVQNIIKYAKKTGKKVRVAGYRHSYEPIFSEDDEIFISLLPLDVAIDIPSIEDTFAPGEGLLQQIELRSESPGEGQRLCKVGVATTTEQLREWCIKEGWAVPLDVVIVETTYGGTIGTMCHGAGISHPTLSDLVYEVEFVDPNGVVQTVSEPELLKAAAGSLGLLGIVTAYTIRLDKMTYAAMRPSQVPIELAVPPPQEYINAARQGDPKYKYIENLISQHTDEEINKATAEFIRQAETYYYAEWVWWPLSRNVWVNTWNNDGVEAESKSIPSNFEAFIQWLEGWLAELITNWPVFQALPGELQAKLFAFFTLTQLANVKPGDPTLTTQVTNGLHFRRGVQNMQVYNMEWFIQIPSKPSPPTAASESQVKRDWSVMQKGWWDGILLMEAEPSVVRIALEMRTMGGSNVILAPQRGNDLGTACVEVLTSLNTPVDEWDAFCQKISDKWNSYTDSNGNRLRARFHWGKQWSFLTFPDGKGSSLNSIDWLRQVAYKDEIPLFLDTLKKIGERGERGGFSVDDLRSRFGNPALESIFWKAPDPVIIQREPDEPSRNIINKIKKWLTSCF